MMGTVYYPRPEILANPAFRKGHVIIEASAGTGKTFTLEHLVLDLIINKRANIEQILVVTFTEAATRELRERIRSLIRKVCDTGTGVRPREKIEHYWEINDVIRTRLQEALFRFDGAAISTIHGFCQRILSEQAFLGGRLFDQEHIDGREAFGFAFREEVRLILAENSPLSEALKVWKEQGLSFTRLQELLYACHREGCPDRSLLTPVWDPAGFWKTLASLPNKEELQDSIRMFFTETPLRNGYLRLINRLFDVVTFVNAGEGLDTEEAMSLFLEWTNKACTINKVKDKQINHIHQAAAVKGAPAVLKKLAAKLEKIALRLAPIGTFLAYQLLPQIQKRLRARKLSLGLMDYDDMLWGVQEALSGKNAQALLSILRQRWKYALVDEFQDTDPVQWDIFRRIFVDGNDDHYLFVIGDPKQAIYGFRGADVYTYELAKEHLLEKCGASRLPLKKNYRSTKELITAVNIILTETDEGGKGFFSGLNHYQEPVEWGGLIASPSEEGQLAVPVHLLHLYGENTGLSAASIRQGIAHFIAKEIYRLTDPQTGLIIDKEKKKPIKLSDIYILTRSGQEGKQIGEVLRCYGIHHAFLKLEGLFKTAEAENIYRLLAAIESPQDSATKMAAWLTPFFEVPLSQLKDWQGASEHHPLTARLIQWKGLADAGKWARLFDDVLTASGLVRRLIFLGKERELTNYIHLFELLLTEVHTRPIMLSELIRKLKAFIDGRKVPPGQEGDMQRLETDKEAVQILTMHKAKGLEAEVIFIAGGFGEPSFDSLALQIYHQGHKRCLHLGKAYGKIGATIEREDSEENQRLAYVALTRAKSRLYLPYFGEAPDGNPTGGNYGYQRLGRFYGTLQGQLDLLRQKGRFDDRGLFVFRDVSCTAPFQTMQATGKTSLKDWPGKYLDRPLPSYAEETGRIKSKHRGVLLTSYTRIKQGESWQPSVYEADGQATWRNEKVEGEATGSNLMELWAPAKEPSNEIQGLPGGRKTGIFIHSLLEEITTQNIAELNREQWSSLPEVQMQAKACARQHGFQEQYLPAALQMVYNAFKTPLRAQSLENNYTLEMPGGIISGKHQQAEMSFVYPIPEKLHPLLKNNAMAVPDALDTVPFKVQRGYIRGLIDLVFEHKGRIYLLDWKSDFLSAFDQDILNKHVQANYSLQAQIYLLAIVRLLGIKSKEKYEKLFGGIIYLFVRGLLWERATEQYTQGLWFSRPHWSQVVQGEQELLDRREWGGKVITLDKMAGGQSNEN